MTQQLQRQTFNLNERVNEVQLSLAWAHLSSPLRSPMPQELKHLTPLEWYLVTDLLEQNLALRELLPLQ